MSFWFPDDTNDKREGDNKSQSGWGNRSDPPQVGTIGDKEVLFKINDRTGDTLLADATPENYWGFNRHSDPDSSIGNARHDHYGPGGGPNDNGTERGFYTGPGSK